MTYVLQKIRKFYPLYFVTTIMCLIFNSNGLFNKIATHHVTIHDLKIVITSLFANLLLIQSWMPERLILFNGPGWFLSTLAFLYIINYPVKYLFREKLNKTSDIMFIYLVFSIVIYLWCYISRDTNLEYTHYMLPLARSGEYICGICIGSLVYQAKDKLCESKVIFTFLEIGAILLVIYSIFSPTDEWKSRIVHWIIPNSILIAVFLIGKGYISDLFRYDVLIYLGDISFEVYLINQLVYRFYITNCGIEVDTVLGRYFSLAYCIVLMVMISMLLHKKKNSI